MESKEVAGLQLSITTKGMPVQAEAWRPTHYNALPGCSCDSERKGETRKGSVADCGFRNKRTVFCGMASMPLKNRPLIIETYSRKN